MRRVVTLLVLAAVLARVSPSRAQRWMASGFAQASSGLEGGGGATSSLRRARTRMRIGGELSVDESPEDAFALAALVDIEPRAAFGVDARYYRVIEGRFALGGGAIGYVVPGILLGPVAAAEYRHPLARRAWLTAGPEVNVFVVGGDLPDRTVVWQALLHLGIRIDL